MDVGVRYVVRETYYSGVELARHALETLGLSRERTQETLERFHEVDRQLLQKQKDVRQDEEKLIQTSKQAATELERILESDEEAGERARV
jgi:glutathione-regulated potassium-efflux system protein KefB